MLPIYVRKHLRVKSEQAILAVLAGWVLLFSYAIASDAILRRAASTPEQIDAFAKDCETGRAAATERLVDSLLASPHFEGETILTADLDLHDIGRGTFDFDVTGRSCRPDIFPLIVNEAPTPAVVTKTGE